MSAMFHQLLRPVGDSLALSSGVALLPIATLLIMLGVLKRPAWQAALAGLGVALAVAVIVWRMPPGLALAAAADGAVFALWPVMWIVINALLLYNIAVASGRFDAFRDWVITNLPNDRRVILIVIGFCFGALLEGVAGFGAPVAITASLLIMVGFSAIDALVFVLIFDTTPVAFGALGAPVTVLAAVTGLPAAALAAMIGRQLPLMAMMLPFYVIALYGGRRSVRALWPMLAIAGVSFGVAQFAASNYLDYTLTDVLAALGSLLATILFLQIWRPAPDPEFAIQTRVAAPAPGTRRIPAWQGWMPWVIVSATVIVWTFFKVAGIGHLDVSWPLLDKAVAITLYGDKPYAAVWAFQPLGMIDVGQLGIGMVEIVIDDHIVVLGPHADLAIGAGQAAFDDLHSVLGAGDQPAAQIGHRRRQDEDPHHIARRLLGHAHGALPIDVEKYITPLRQGVHHWRARAAVKVLVHLRPFQQRLIGDHGVKRRPVDEIILPPLLLARPRRPGGARDR